MSKEEFFKVFGYDHLMHDAMDYCIVYFEVVITNDIKFAGGQRLVAGTQYEQCVFNIRTGNFSFENYPPCEDAASSVDPIPEKSIVIPQNQLARYCYW